MYYIFVHVMRSEKPYTNLDYMISRFSWHRTEERTRSILKKIVSKAQFYVEVWRSKFQSYKKLVSRKKCLKFFFHDCKQLMLILDNILWYRSQLPMQISWHEVDGNCKAGHRRLARSPWNAFATRKHVRNEKCVEVYSRCCGHFMRQISRVLRLNRFMPETVKLRNQRYFLAKKNIFKRK